MDEREYENSRRIKEGSALFRLPKGVRPILWEEEDQILLRASERARREHEIRTHGLSIELTESGLINHLIGLIDLGREGTSIILDHFGESYSVNPKFRLSFEGCKKTIDSYILPFIKPRRQLIAISQFVGKTLNSAIGTILQEFCVQFLSKHADAVKKYYVDTNLGLQTLFTSLYELVQPLTITYNVLSTVLSEDMWDFHVVERFLERFLRIMTFVELQTEESQNVIKELQHAIFPLLERYFDFIFKNGFVEPVYAEEFPFYNISEADATSIKLREPLCSLWSKEFIKSVLNGSRDARRLKSGQKDSKHQAFSHHFRECLPWQESSMMTCEEFMKRIYKAAELCASDNAKMLFFFMNESNKLSVLLDEIEQVYTGFSLRDLAYDLFGADRTTSNCDIAVSFYNSLRSSGFGEDSCDRWSVNCSSGYLDDLNIRPKIDWPLIYIISDDLIETFNKCLRFLLQLIRASELLSKIRIEYTDVDKFGLNKRRFNLLLCVISQPLTIMAELFFTHLSSLMSKKLPSIRDAKTIEEAQEHVMSLTRLLNNLVMKEGARKLIHEAIVKLWSMSDEIYDRLRMDCMKPSDLENLLKVAIREKQLLVGIGKGMEGTFFMALQLFLP